jgi:hypothetical protein
MNVIELTVFHVRKNELLLLSFFHFRRDDIKRNGGMV